MIQKLEHWAGNPNAFLMKKLKVLFSITRKTLCGEYFRIK
jgi:hypothetical protein